jgi:hypothetical protein
MKRLNTVYASVSLLCASLAVVNTYAKVDVTQFIGGYREETEDSVTEFYLLADQTYCFATARWRSKYVSTTAGRWQATENGLALEEVKSTPPYFSVIGKTDAKRKNRVLDFQGPSLSDDRSIVFGVSTDGKLPREMTPIFSEEQRSFAFGGYEKDVPAGASVSLFVGRAVDKAASSGSGSRVYKVIQYPIENSKHNTFKISFNSESVRPPTRIQASAHDKHIALRFNGHDKSEKFGGRRAISQAFLADIREQCIDPILKPTPAVADPSITEFKMFREHDVILDVSKIAPLFQPKPDDKD